MKSAERIELRNACEDDLDAIRDIYNHYVRTSTCTYQLEQDDAEATRRWFSSHDPAIHPIIVCERANRVVGWGSLSPHRERRGYRHTVENSVYVDPAHQHEGIGSALLAELVARAESIGHHAVLAGIDAEQAASIALHERFGFVRVAHFREIGFKFDRWLDVLYLQRLTGR